MGWVAGWGVEVPMRVLYLPLRMSSIMTTRRLSRNCTSNGGYSRFIPSSRSVVSTFDESAVVAVDFEGLWVERGGGVGWASVSFVVRARCVDSFVHHFALLLFIPVYPLPFPS